jgi:two-component system response regulator MprA
MKKILVIDDDPVAGTVYQRFLQSHGYDVDLATDGAQALERVPDFQPDALVLDWMMPKMSGNDVLRSIRADADFCQLRIVVLTNACVPLFVDQAREAGANGILDKSKDTPSAILAMLERLLLSAPGTRLVFDKEGKLTYASAATS